MIYLDSAATTFQKPPSVAAAMAEAMATMSSPGRGGHRAALLASQILAMSVWDLASDAGLRKEIQEEFAQNLAKEREGVT